MTTSGGAKAPRMLELVTPEAIRLSFPLASLGARLMAFGIDMTILLFAVVMLSVAGMVTSMSGMMLIGAFLIRQFYFVVFEVLWHGATPGKRALGLRVVSRDGRGLSVDAIFARNLLRDVELFIPALVLFTPEAVMGAAPTWVTIVAGLWAILVALMPLLTRENLRAGDLVGGTVVVAVPRALLIQDEAAPASRASSRGQALVFTEAQLSIYGEHELETLATVMRRIEDGQADRGDQAHIARTIAAKIGYRGPEPSSEPKRFLRAFYKQQRAALEKRLLFGKRKASKLDQRPR